MVLSYTWSVLAAQMLVTSFAQPRGVYIYDHPDPDFAPSLVFSLVFRILDEVTFTFFTRALDGGFAVYNGFNAQLAQQGPNVYTFNMSTVNEWYKGILNPGFEYNASIQTGDLATVTFTTGDSLRIPFEGVEYDLPRRAFSLQGGRFSYQGERSRDVSMVFSVQAESSSASSTVLHWSFAVVV